LLTCDALFNGKLVVCQQRSGYRFAIDAVLLAGLATVRPNDRILDLGTGCGVIPLILAHRRLGKRIVGLEIQPELVAVAQRNVEVNGFSDRIRIYERDFREISSDFERGGFDLVISNPPYRRLRSGRLNPDGQRAIARHELKSSLADVFRTASTLLGHGGRLSIIYPASRLAHLLVTAHDCHLTPKQLTMIHSDAVSVARLVHLECRKGSGEELRITSPFFIYREDKTYTESMRKLYEDGPDRDAEVTSSQDVSKARGESNGSGSKR
jgi:tRNA1Val (adenine37-N6)-methyltransferase